MKQLPPRRRALSSESRKSIAFLQATLYDVYPQNMEEWEDGFRRDANPEREIQRWLNLAGVFKYFTDGKALTREQRKDIFDLILLACTNGPETVSLTFTPQVLSKSRTQEILDELKKLWDAAESVSG